MKKTKAAAGAVCTIGHCQSMNKEALWNFKGLSNNDGERVNFAENLRNSPFIKDLLDETTSSKSISIFSTFIWLYFAIIWIWVGFAKRRLRKHTKNLWICSLHWYGTFSFLLCREAVINTVKRTEDRKEGGARAGVGEGFFSNGKCYWKGNLISPFWSFQM
jgi:hypothetical protein